MKLRSDIVTDGAMSRPRQAPAAPSPLCRNATLIEFDIPNRRVHPDVSDDEQAARRAEMMAQGDKGGARDLKRLSAISQTKERGAKVAVQDDMIRRFQTGITSYLQAAIAYHPAQRHF